MTKVTPLRDYNVALHRRERIVASVACCTGVPVDDLLGRSRDREPTDSRHIAMWAMYELTGADNSGTGIRPIGRFFDRHHTTVLEAITNIKRRREGEFYRRHSDSILTACRQAMEGR